MKYEIETDQGVSDVTNIRAEIDQNRGKAQEHSKYAIIIAPSVRKHTDASCHVSGRGHLQKIPTRKTALFGQETEADIRKEIPSNYNR